jgi:hypothetical protein
MSNNKEYKRPAWMTLTPERLAELRSHLKVIEDDRHEDEMDGTADQATIAALEAFPELLDEIDRLRADNHRLRDLCSMHSSEVRR